VQAYLPSNVNSWKGQEVRHALEPLRQLAAARELAVVLVQHLNRRSDAVDPLARIADSQGIPQLARSVLVWGPDPSDEEGDQGAQKALTRAKNNLARSTVSATFTIVERTIGGGIKAPSLTRGEDRQIAADDVVSDHETRSATEEAAEWLRELLAAGPVPAKDVWKRAREVGIAERTLKRAKRNAGAISESTRDINGFAGWAWTLRSTNRDGPLDTLGTLGPLPQGKKANKANSSNGAKYEPQPTDAQIQAAFNLREKTA
jgi:putative DNA primase/helicase